MKPYHVKLRWVCETCHHFEDKDFYFDTIFPARRCLSQALLHLNFDVGFLMHEDEVLIHIDRNRKEVCYNETQR